MFMLGRCWVAIAVALGDSEPHRTLITAFIASRQHDVFDFCALC